MANWYHDICSDSQARQVGVYFDTDAETTLIEVLPERSPSVIIENLISHNPVLLGEGYLGFCGSCPTEYGAINYTEHTFWKKSGRVRFHGVDSDGFSFAVQIGNKLLTLDSASGDQRSVRSATNEIVAIGRSWSAETTESELILLQHDLEPMRFARSNDIGDITESNGHVLLNERQGPLRVIPLGRRNVIQEIVPERGSEFRRAAISKCGLLTYSQHFFEEPRTTYVRQRLLTENEDLNHKSIGVSGHNQLVNDGAEILFATCQVFDSTTASLIGAI